MKIDQEKDLVCWTFYRIYFCFSTISKMCPKQPIPFLIVDITYQYHIFKLMRDLCPDHPILVDSLDFQFKLPSWSCMWVLRGFLPILVSNRRTIALFDFKLSKYNFFILFLRFAWAIKTIGNRYSYISN